jgi:hypothetical protein
VELMDVVQRLEENEMLVAKFSGRSFKGND